MNRNRLGSFGPLLALALLLPRVPAPAAGGGFRPLFDGRTLAGWSAPDMRYWSVADGAITARSSKRP